MALISIIPDFHPLRNDKLLARAAELTPELVHTACVPVDGPDPGRGLGKGDTLLLDFGTHLVGYVSLDLAHTGSHPDAPVYIKLRFAEIPEELEEQAEAYDGWLARGWIQEEFVHVDTLPARLALPRRYAFRYLEITVIDTSPKFRLTVEHAQCDAVTSADRSLAKPPEVSDPVLERIYAASLRTLANCMQEVFEDGPKRDRRLWLGDLRLQALTNYVSFRNYDLVKRCLYLFGGSRFPDGRAAACLFTRPEPEADDTFLFDYALLYPAALEEYLRETADAEALDDLYAAAMDQIDYGLAQCDEHGVVGEQAARDCFIDWCDDLDRSACAQGVLIYALGFAISLAERKRDLPRAGRLRREREKLRAAAMERFWSAEQGCFVSNGQISAASQVWMVLADVPSPEQAGRAMRTALSLTGGQRMATPYMHHYYVTALLKTGLPEEALRHLKAYWGGMLDAGADTFWECWDPAHPDASPYGGRAVNSYCHAWSCTPAYLMDRFLNHPQIF